MPERVQLRREKGWRMPANTVSVTRPGPNGNPFAIQRCDSHYGGNWRVIHVGVFATYEAAAEAAVAAYREWVEKSAVRVARIREDLRGKNLACWCALSSPCHADVLLEIANR